MSFGDNYTAQAPALVGDHVGLLERVRAEVGPTGTAVIGFDFPIGIPAHYANSIGVTDFRAFLLQLGEGDFADFYRIAQKSSDISKYRPFYPHNPGGTKQSHLLSALGITQFNHLRRRCELGCERRRPACPLFWTLGANQVGRAAIIGWRDVIIPVLRKERFVLLWPFDGRLNDLLKPGNVVVVETYPAECYRWFLKSGLTGKGKLDVRKKAGTDLFRWARQAGVTFDTELGKTIEHGFPNGGDDAFDAVLGVFGILEVLLNRREPGEPNDRLVRNLEGWILGVRTTTICSNHG